jgi:hypothetical protein
MNVNVKKLPNNKKLYKFCCVVKFIMAESHNIHKYEYDDFLRSPNDLRLQNYLNSSNVCDVVTPLNKRSICIIDTCFLS